ncbi:MAG: hypothetical protein LBP81_00605 [Treponema sp.]|nr:hypothetical protein [Treponema sp.]
MKYPGIRRKYKPCGGNSRDRILEVRASLIELRKNLGMQGYDLSLGDRDLYWLTGTDNHIALQPLPVKIDICRLPG